MKATIIMMVCLAVLLTSCNALFPDEKITLQRKDYTGNELKTDGYYYCQEENYEYTIVMFLFRNGIVLSARAYLTLDLNIVETKMIQRYNTLRKEKIGWGIFSIKNNQIEIEQWNASTGFSLPTITNYGYIENDTTIRIVEQFFSDIQKTYQRNEVWHFKQFTNKPDSTNSYIK